MRRKLVERIFVAALAGIALLLASDVTPSGDDHNVRGTTPQPIVHEASAPAPAAEGPSAPRSDDENVVVMRGPKSIAGWSPTVTEIERDDGAGQRASPAGQELSFSARLEAACLWAMMVFGALLWQEGVFAICGWGWLWVWVALLTLILLLLGTDWGELRRMLAWFVGVASMLLLGIRDLIIVWMHGVISRLRRKVPFGEDSGVKPRE